MKKFFKIVGITFAVLFAIQLVMSLALVVSVYSSMEDEVSEYYTPEIIEEYI